MVNNILEKHQQQHGKAHAKLSADRRYLSVADESKAYEAKVKHVSICKPGYRSEQCRPDKMKKNNGSKTLELRAGFEGIICRLMWGLEFRRFV